MLKSKNLPARLVALALCVFLISNLLDLSRAHAELAKSIEAQKATLARSKKVEAQLDALAKGVNELGSAGNANAQRIIAVLKQNGVNIKER